MIIPASADDDIASIGDYSSLIVVPSTDNVKPGEPFTVDVFLNPSEPISGVQFDLTFIDYSGCTVANVEEGDFFSKHMALTSFGNIVKPDSDSYSTIYSAALGPHQILEPGNLARIQMIAGSSPGYLTIELSDIIVSNSRSQESTYKVENTKVLVDSKPVLSPMETVQVAEGNSVSFIVNAFDPDYDHLSFSSDSLPEGASLDASTGAFEWTPSVEQIGEYMLEFVVNDGYLSDQQSITIVVSSSSSDDDTKYMSLTDLYRWLRINGYRD